MGHWYQSGLRGKCFGFKSSGMLYQYLFTGCSTVALPILRLKEPSSVSNVLKVSLFDEEQ